MKALHTSVWSGFFRDLPITEAMDELMKEGFRHSEYSISHIDSVMSCHSDAEKAGRQVAAEAAARGFSFPQGHVHYMQGLCRQEDRDLIKRDIDLFQAIGIKNAVLHFNGGNELPYDEKIATRMAAVRELSDYVKGTDMILCLENLGSVPETHTAERLIGIIESIGSPNLGICLDAGHLHLTNGRGETSQTHREFIEKAGSLLHALHVTDNNGVFDAHQMPFSARSGIDWKAFMSAIKDSAYDDLFNLEIPGEIHSSLALRRAKLHFIRIMIDEMMSEEFLSATICK